MNSDIIRLHDFWCRLTDQQLPLGVCSFELEYGYHQFIKAGYTEGDMLLVVRYLQAEIKRGERKPAALRWSSCIGDTLRFAEELSLARGALRRKPPVTARQRALTALRPTAGGVTPEDTRVTARPVGDYIAALRQAAEGGSAAGGAA